MLIDGLRFYRTLASLRVFFSIPRSLFIFVFLHIHDDTSYTFA